MDKGGFGLLHPFEYEYEYRSTEHEHEHDEYEEVQSDALATIDPTP
jgi:hypothetical protein